MLPSFSACASDCAAGSDLSNARNSKSKAKAKLKAAAASAIRLQAKQGDKQALTHAPNHLGIKSQWDQRILPLSSLPTPFALRRHSAD